MAGCVYVNEISSEERVGNGFAKVTGDIVTEPTSRLNITLLLWRMGRWETYGGKVMGQKHVHHSLASATKVLAQLQIIARTRPQRKPN